MSGERFNMEILPSNHSFSAYSKVSFDDEYNYSHEKLDYTGVLTPSPYIAKNEATEKMLNVVKKVYDGAQMVTYYFLVGVVGVILAFVWGIVFGVLNFATVFAVQPALRIVATSFRCLNIVSVAFNKMCCDPVYASIGLAFSRIGGKMDVSYRKVETV